MEGWFGLRPTGRQFREPAATQHELEDDDGLRYTAIAFDAAWRGHPALTRDVALVRSFLEYPMVVGLVELAHADLHEAVFAYPTGVVWTVREMLRIHADLALPVGLRAGLELAWLAGQTLVEAAENGAVQGCFSHGGLTPWRIALRTDGQVQVMGYGLPQVDVLAHRADERHVVDADSLRYAPPERLAGIAEDPAADTTALTLIAYEVITGQPLYGGHDVAVVKPQVAMSEGAAVLSRPNDLPRPVAAAFARALVFDPEARLSGRAWVDEVGELLRSHQDGDSLEAVADRLRGTRREGPRRSAKLVPTETGEFTAAEVREATAEEGTPVGPETRWSRAERAHAAAGPAADDGAPLRRRRRRDDPPTAEVPAAPPEVAGEPRRRRRNPALAASGDEDPAGVPESPLEEDGDDLVLEAPTQPDDEAKPRLRRRADAEAGADAAPPPSRRRRRREE